MNTPYTPLARYMSHIAHANHIILKEIVNENQNNNTQIQKKTMETILSKTEYSVLMDVLERIGGKHIVDFDSCIFKFANISTGNFLKELPKVVNILASHKSELEYDDFIRSLSQVVYLISEIYDWKFCLDTLSDLCESLNDTRAEMLKRGGKA